MEDQDQSIAGRLDRLSRHLAPSSERERAHVRRDPVEPRLITPGALGAEECPGRRGRYWLRTKTYDPTEPWGEIIPDLLYTENGPPPLRIPFDGSGEEIDLSGCLFVDCETTGLSGGAGTVSFLTAVGRLTDEGFTVEQFFLPDLAEEAGKLDALADRLESARALVTYNGAAFDLPLLEGRFRFWRLDPSFCDLPHLDLLWPTRAIFKPRIRECNLGNVEARLLKFPRVEDIPGAEVPQVYFDYLRLGYSPRMHAVFEHNRLDVVSLFVYAVWLMKQTQPLAPTLSDPDDLLSLARYWFRCRLYEPAIAALDAAEARVLGSSQRAYLSELRGRLLKRERRYDEAHAHWEQLARDDPNRIEAAEELAKHLEHRRREFGEALAIVDNALDRLQMQETLSGADVEDERQRLLHRRARLVRRIQSSRTDRQSR
jgi:uncharacterized protein YprB with RNaseH-like and TPR domain